jgi:hypothetical protein
VCHSIIGLSLLSLQAISTVHYWEYILLPDVVPFLQAHPDMTFQYDNDTSLAAYSVHNFLQWQCSAMASEEPESQSH